MKLKFMNNSKSTSKLLSCLKIALCLPLITSFRCIESVGTDQPVAKNPDSGSQKQTSHNSIASGQEYSNKDVTNLHLTSDYRSVKLRWSYQQNDTFEPTSFNIRYCELTSWNIEIKCRHRDLRVDLLPSRANNNDETHQTKEKSVIKGSSDLVRRLEPLNGHTYEAQIYDLRALTNYTFQVHASRLSEQLEPEAGKQSQAPAQQIARTQAARRLELGRDASRSLSSRVETKPFAAVATKCLADVSEVVVNTGKYFGGRISVENSLDPGCSLIGNKSSEQTSYIFRINHDLCNSRVMDGNRIETMILVHENKDILTHNTARFLVLCHFLQKSFTLRASISLPKVNGVFEPSRPAVITSLPGKPILENSIEEHATSVMLGSMPGIYRQRVGANNIASNASADHGKLIKYNKEVHANYSSSKLSEFESANTIDRDTRGESRQGKELVRDSSSSLPAGRARSLTLSPRPDNGPDKFLALPQPIQVQSKVMHIERPNSATISGSVQQIHARIGQQQVTPNSFDLPDSKTTGINEMHAMSVSDTAPALRESRIEKQLTNLKRETELADSLPDPIVMTNNHRVTGDYLPIAQATSPGDNSYTIKYSADKVDEYSVGRENGAPIVEPKTRTRSGRMRSSDAFNDSDNNTNHYSSSGFDVNRMGDMAREDQPSAEVGSEMPTIDRVNSTLAQNITNFLLKWSLKTITNLAKKSLESLAKLNHTTAVDPIDYPSDTFLMEPDQIDQVTTNSASLAMIGSKNITNPLQESVMKDHSANPVIHRSQPLELLVNEGSAKNLKRIEEKFPQNKHQNASFAKLKSILRPQAKSNTSSNQELSQNTILSRQNNSEKSKLSAGTRHHTWSTKQDQWSPHWSEGVRDDGFYSSWMFYTMVASFSLMTAILLVFWLIVSLSRRPSSIRIRAERAISPETFSDSITALDQGYNSNAPDTCERQGISYEKYDYKKYENITKDHRSNLRNGLFSSCNLIKPKLMNSSLSSQSTQSFSVGSTLMADENDCKNNEFLFTEHVLINSGNTSRESYA